MQLTGEPTFPKCHDKTHSHTVEWFAAMSTTAAAAKKQTITEQARGSPATATEEKSFKTEENLSFKKKKKLKQVKE